MSNLVFNFLLTKAEEKPKPTIFRALMKQNATRKIFFERTNMRWENVEIKKGCESRSRKISSMNRDNIAGKLFMRRDDS